MTVTIDDLAEQFSDAADDGAHSIWAETLVIAWVYEAIQDFSLHVPPVYHDKATDSAGEHVYELAGEARGIISVEYPAGESPPRYLRPMSYGEPAFWLSDDYYHFLDRSRESGVPLLILSRAGDGSEYELYWRGAYEVTGLSSEECPVPVQYHHILLAYVHWRAMTNRIAKESQSPDTTTLLLSQLASNADRAERAYRRWLADAQGSVTKGGPVGPWVMDKHG